MHEKQDSVQDTSHVWTVAGVDPALGLGGFSLHPTSDRRLSPSLTLSQPGIGI